MVRNSATLFSMFAGKTWNYKECYVSYGQLIAKKLLENVAAGVLKGIQDHIDQKIEINFAYTA